jgi:predicted TIM-barrel fold metal-dependent hydrolase
VTGLEPNGWPPAIIDAHHHFWELRRFYYPWLAGADGAGPPAGLPASYLRSSFADDVAGLPMAGSVVMEAGRDDAMAEAAWLASCAAASGPQTGVVARVQLEAGDAAAQLETLAAMGPVRGVRQVLNFACAVGGPAYQAPRPDLIDDPGWRRGLALVQDARLIFDLQVQPAQLLQAARLATDFGGLTFVLDHGGYMARRSADTDRLWRAGIRALARSANVAVKACDYSTIDPAFESCGFTGFVRELVEVFGPGRTLFASNFPGEGRAISYRRLAEKFDRALSILGPAERCAVWADNAQRIYGLDRRPQDRTAP